MTGTASPIHALVQKLRRLAPLAADDEQALLSLTWRQSSVDAHQYLVREGSEPKECCLLVDGFACRSKLAADGGRQIVSFHIAGDMLDVQHLHLERADHDVQAVTKATVAWVPIAELRSLIAGRPPIAQAFWRDALIDAAIFREWVVNVGRRDAKTRIAHMLCEFVARCEAAGLGGAEGTAIPFTQVEIADATGLTPVHVNRMLKELAGEGVVGRVGQQLQVQDWAGLQRAATFDRAYLHAAA